MRFWDASADDAAGHEPCWFHLTDHLLTGASESVNFVTRPSIASFEPTDAVDLKGSLERFRELAGQLGESEGLLQAHVAELRDQLAEAGAQSPRTPDHPRITLRANTGERGD